MSSTLKNALFVLTVGITVFLPPLANAIPREVLPSAGCFKNQGEGIASDIGPGDTVTFDRELPDTQKRTHSLTLPLNYDHENVETPSPLLLYFHGWGGKYNSCGSLCDDAAEKGFATVSMSGYGPIFYGSWKIAGSTTSPGPLGPTCEPQAPDYCEFYKNSGCDCSEADNCWWTTCYDSVAQVLDVMDLIEEDICIDKNQIWATGCSNGGMFTFDLASDERSAPRIRGIVPVVGLPHYGFSVGPLPDSDMAMFGMWGVDDTTVPPFSFTDNPDKTVEPNGWYYTSVPKVMEDFTVGNACEGNGQDSIDEDNDFGISSVSNFACSQGCSEREDGVRVIGCIFDGGHDCYGSSVSFEPAFNYMLSFSNITSCGSDPDPNAKFWTGFKVQGEPIEKSCKWLAKRTENQIDYFCGLDESFEGSLPAQAVCTGTCNSC